MKKYFNSSPNLSKFLPDNADFRRLPRSFLFTIIYQEDKELYVKLTKLEKEETVKSKMKNFSKYYVEVVDEFADAIGNISELQGKHFINHLEFEAKQNKKFIRKTKRKIIMKALKQGETS